MPQHLVFDPEQSVSVWHVCRPRDAISQTFFAPVWRETSSQPSPFAVLQVVSAVQKRGQLVAGAQTLPPPKSQQACPLPVSHSESEEQGLSQDAAQMPLLLPSPLLPGPTTPPPPLEDEEQPPNQATSTVAAIRVANTLRFFIRPSTIDEVRAAPLAPSLSNLSSYPNERPRSRMSLAVLEQQRRSSGLEVGASAACARVGAHDASPDGSTRGTTDGRTDGRAEGARHSSRPVGLVAARVSRVAQSPNETRFRPPCFAA